MGQGGQWVATSVASNRCGSGTLRVLQAAGQCSTMNWPVHYMTFGCLPDSYVDEKPVYSYLRLGPNYFPFKHIGIFVCFLSYTEFSNTESSIQHSRINLHLYLWHSQQFMHKCKHLTTSLRLLV